MASTTPPATTAKAHRYLTHVELGALADACGEDRWLVLLAGYTDLRWGEVSALRVRDLNPMTGRLNVERAYSSVGGKLLLGEMKTHERRQVVVPRFLREDLARLMQGKDRDDLLFTASRGGPLDGRNWAERVLEKAWCRCRVKSDPLVPAES